jgi:hypothetical protein
MPFFEHQHVLPRQTITLIVHVGKEPALAQYEEAIRNGLIIVTLPALIGRRSA